MNHITPLANNWRDLITHDDDDEITIGEPIKAEADKHFETAKCQVRKLYDGIDRTLLVRAIRPADGKTEALFGTIADIWSEIKRLNADGFNVYFLPQSSIGFENADVTRIDLVFADFDDQELPANFHQEPHLIIQRSATRSQVFWRVTGVPVEEFPRIGRSITKHYGSDGSCVNAGRLMRVCAPFAYRNVKNADGRTETERYPGHIILSSADRPAYTLEEIIAGLPELPPEATHRRSTATGAGVTWAGLRNRLSYIHPAFDGARPACYPAQSAKRAERPLSYSGAAWVSIGLCIRDAAIPLIMPDGTPDEREHDWFELVEEWSDGTLWRERTGEALDAGTLNVPPEGIRTRLQGHARPAGADTTTIATINAYAADAGCPLPPDDEPHTGLKDAAQALVDNGTIAASEPDTAPVQGQPGSAELNDEQEEWERGVGMFKRRSMVAGANLPPLEHWDPDTKILVKSPGGYTISVVGEKGCNKTNTVLSLCFAALRDGAVVVYGGAEDTFGLEKYRNPAQAKHKGLDLVELDRSRNFTLHDCVPDLASAGTSRDQVDMLITAIRRELDPGQVPDIYIADTLGFALLGEEANEDSSKTAYRTVKNIARLREAFPGLLVILVGHTGHEGTRIRGTSAWGQVLDGSVLVKSDKSDPENVKIDVHVQKVKNGPDNFHVPFKVVKVDGVPVPVPMTVQEAAVVRLEAGRVKDAGSTGEDLRAAVVGALHHKNIYGREKAITLDVLVDLVMDRQPYIENDRERTNAADHLKKKITNRRTRRAYGAARNAEPELKGLFVWATTQYLWHLDEGDRAANEAAQAIAQNIPFGFDDEGEV